MGPQEEQIDIEESIQSTRNQTIKALCWFYAMDEDAAKRKYKSVTVEQCHDICAQYREYIEQGGV